MFPVSAHMAFGALQWGVVWDIQPTCHMCTLYLAQIVFGGHMGGREGVQDTIFV